MIHTFATLLMTTLAPLNFEVVEDASNLPLLNPEMAERKTLKLKLSNGLEALLIHDPAADQSAASVSVGAGSWNDPLEYPGMAHFCEHMLFMGTKKYPSENEFFTSVTNYAGMTNAYTAPNRTVYMFSVQTPGFLTLLDQFGHFFIDPLFNPGNIAREMHAVDQEFAKNLEHDGWREYMIFKETGNANHPNRMFSTGNSETLGKIPQSALKNWHEANYSAEQLHLVVYSSLPLETLQKNVVELFNQVPVSEEKPLDHSEPLSSPEQLGHITYIKPIQNKQTLTLSWELPPELSDDPTKSADILAYALKRGQEHSLYEKLKSEQLIDSVSVRVDELGGKTHRFFQITLELTKKGIGEIETTVLRCFEAIEGLRECEVPNYLFNEKNTMAQLNYQYQGRKDPFEYTMNLGDSLGDEDLSTFPRNSLLSTQYDPEKIHQVAEFLTPQNASLSLMASPQLTKVTPDRKEKWMQAEYAIRPIPSAWMATWEAAKPNPDICLAKPNPYIPVNLSLASKANNTPIEIADDSLGIAYYVRSSEFGSPDSIYHIHILTPEITSSARSAVLTSLYIDHLTDVIHPTLAAANSAGLSCNIEADRCSIHLEISGYSEKAPLLLREVAKQMPLNPPTEEQFAIYVARHEKGYANGQKELAARQARELLESIINPDKTTKREKLAALQSITYEDFLNFHKNLFEMTYIKALFAGNLTLKEAESAWLDVIHAFSKEAYPKEAHPETKILQLTDLKGPYQITQTTEIQGNAALLLIDEGGFTFEKRSAQEVLASAIKEAFFNELRTKQKTGYIATSDCLEVEARLFQYFLVQSNSHQPNDLLYRFEQFLEEFNDALTENITIQRFETLKTSLISSLKTRFRNLKDKTALWDRLAFVQNGEFDFVENRIAALEELSYEEFIADAQSFLSRNNRKRLAILFEGKLPSPFAYQPLELSQLKEIATYAPREKPNLQEAAANTSLEE